MLDNLIVRCSWNLPLNIRGANSDPGEFTGCSISKEQATADVQDTNDMLSAQLGYGIYRLYVGGCVYNPRLSFFG